MLVVYNYYYNVGYCIMVLCNDGIIIIIIIMLLFFTLYDIIV